MSVTIGTEVWIRLGCDSGWKCKYRDGGGTLGGFEGKTEADVLQQAKQHGWKIDGQKAICRDCMTLKNHGTDFKGGA
jgi:hypothetical protein